MADSRITYCNKSFISYARYGIVTTVYSSTVLYSIQFLLMSLFLYFFFSSFLRRCCGYCTSLSVCHCLSFSSLFTCFFTSDLLALIGFRMSNSFYIHCLGDFCSRVRSSGEILNPPISVQRLYCLILVPTLILCLFKALSHCFSRLYARSI